MSLSEFKFCVLSVLQCDQDSLKSKSYELRSLALGCPFANVKTGLRSACAKRIAIIELRRIQLQTKMIRRTGVVKVAEGRQTKKRRSLEKRSRVF